MSKHVDRILLYANCRYVEDYHSTGDQQNDVPQTVDGWLVVGQTVGRKK